MKHSRASVWFHLSSVHLYLYYLLNTSYYLWLFFLIIISYHRYVDYIKYFLHKNSTFMCGTSNVHQSRVFANKGDITHLDIVGVVFSEWLSWLNQVYLVGRRTPLTCDGGIIIFTLYSPFSKLIKWHVHSIFMNGLGIRKFITRKHKIATPQMRP